MAVVGGATGFVWGVVTDKEWEETREGVSRVESEGIPVGGALAEGGREVIDV